MRTCIRHPFLLPVLLAVLGLTMGGGRATAQTFTDLHVFSGSPNDGGGPYGTIIRHCETLYGTTHDGGIGSAGTVFAINTNGGGFTILRSIDPSVAVGPYGGLVLLGNTLYGTTSSGGGSSGGNGTVFKVNTDSTGFTNVYTLTGSDGNLPYSSLIANASGNTLYGTAPMGGSLGSGTLFKVNTDGTGFTNLHQFSATSSPSYTNSDGAGPWGSLVLSESGLYGTAVGGGDSGNGTVFKLNTDGTGFTNLHSFTTLNNNTNSDGYAPLGGLILLGNTLYGTTAGGGGLGNGTVFSVNTDGTGFTNLHDFNGSSDGGNPTAALILSGNTLYGTTLYGGTSGGGTVFALNIDGTGFTKLHSLAGSDGGGPWAGLVLSCNTLYGTARAGGSSGNGTVFSISFTPQLSIALSERNVVLTWPTNYAGFDYTGFTLQSTTNLLLPVWTTNSPSPVVINGQNTVTNPISGSQQFFRLSQ